MGQSYTCTCMHLHFEWSGDSALVLQILHIQFSPVLVMSWTVVIVNMNLRGVSAKKNFCIYQSATWLGRNRILVVLWTIIFLFKVKLCKSCLKTCNWFVVWLRMTSEFLHLLSHLLRLERGCSGFSFFPFNPLNPKGLFTWSGGPRSSGVGFFCFHPLGDTKQKKPTPPDRGEQHQISPCNFN